jgi:hypothetical protein
MEIKKLKFNGTIEFLSGQKAAIITLTDNHGEWSGSGRIDLPRGSKSDLYELGYTQASRSAAAKGGTLETYKVIS